jgi:hypothetical protein
MCPHYILIYWYMYYSRENSKHLIDDKPCTWDHVP